MNTYPLYTVSFEGKSYDENKAEYELVIITKWTDHSASAREDGHKAYYFHNANDYIWKNRNNEDVCKEIYENYPEYSKLTTKEVLVCLN